MDSQNIIITNRLTETQMAEAAAILYNAFGEKLRAYILKGDPKKGENCIKESLNPQYGFYAVQDKMILGFVGLDYGKTKFISYKFVVFKKYYGFLGALWRTIVNVIFTNFFERLAKDIVHIGKIAVSEKARGLGIGTLLLNASFDKTRKLGFNIITLEVIDTNPRAQKLYEKLGFTVDKSQNFGFLTASAGFSRIYCMSKQID